MTNTKNIQVRFLHPIDGRIITVTLDQSYAGDEVINELISNQFLSASPGGYSLAIKGGRVIGKSESFESAQVKDGDTIRIIPATDAGGSFSATAVESAIPGLKK